MRSTTDPRDQGPNEEAARRAAGLDNLDQQAGSGASTSEGTGGDPAPAAGSPSGPNDVEQIHEALPGFADAVETPPSGSPDRSLEG